MDKNKLLQQVEKIYKENAEEDKRLCEDFLSISLKTIKFDFQNGNTYNIGNTILEVRKCQQ